MKKNNAFVLGLRKAIEAEGYTIKRASSELGFAHVSSLHHLLQSGKMSRESFDNIVARYPSLKSLVNVNTLKRCGRVPALNKGNSNAYKVMRVRDVSPAPHMARAPKQKPSKGVVNRVSTDLVKAILSLYKDKKALFNIQGLLITAAADGIGIAELQELLGNA